MAGERLLNAQPALKQSNEREKLAGLALEWDNLTIGQWKELLASTPRSNLLLSWPVALATYETKRQRPHFGVFYQGQKPVALVVVHHWKFTVFEKVHISRGPLWLIDPTDEMKAAALKAIKSSWPSKPLRHINFMPELPNTDNARRLMGQAGFRPRPGSPYRSLWLDMTPPADEMEKNLKKGWKSGLRKSRKNKLKYTADYTRPGFRLFLRGYKRDKSLKKYRGPSVLFLINLRKHARREDVLMLEAWHEGQLVAGQFFVRHGQAATYLVGWTTPAGRDVAAHNGLLFDAALPALKKRGITTLDLGGLSKNNHALNHFKKGLGGEVYELAGQWRG